MQDVGAAGLGIGSLKAPLCGALPSLSDVARPEPPAAAGEPGVVLERRDVTADLMLLRVGKPAGLLFRAGQHIKLGVGGLLRSYSIASAPGQPYLEFCIERVAGGRLTPALWRLAVGDRVELGARAKGDLVLDEQARLHLMAATVTGVAPFMSMLRQEVGTHVSGRRFLLLHGGSYAAELVYRDELEAMAARHASFFRYVPAVSRPGEAGNAGWTGETGRLPSIVARYAAEMGLGSEPSRAYACGNPAMVAAVEAQLASARVLVSTESYW